MAVAKEEILEAISNMTVMEVVDLISAMEEKFGVSAAAAVAAAPAAAAAPAEAAAGQSSLSLSTLFLLLPIQPRVLTAQDSPGFYG